MNVRGLNQCLFPPPPPLQITRRRKRTREALDQWPRIGKQRVTRPRVGCLVKLPFQVPT